MKPGFAALFIATVLLASCASSPEEMAAAETTPPTGDQVAKAEESSDPTVPPEAAPSLPVPPKDEFGLLEPPDLLGMPSEQDMKPSVDSRPSVGAAVIATPPTD